MTMLDRMRRHKNWLKWSLFVVVLAFILLYVLFSKLFPIVSIWEIREGREKGLGEAVERIRGYLPGAERAVP